MAGGGAERPEARPYDLGDAWSALTNNTLRKTGPQIFLGIWFWGLVFGRHDFDPQTPNDPSLILAFAAAFFYAIVFRRVLRVLPRRQLPVPFLHFWLLFMAYTLWLGFALPVHRGDVREWLGWFAMATGLIACLILVVPVASGSL